MPLLPKILTCLLTAILAAQASCAGAQNPPADTQRIAKPGDEVLLQMQQAFAKRDRSRLALLLPAARGHVLESWAAYWELRVRLGDVQPKEIEAFLRRWAGSYQEDRLRNDWLLLLGQRRQWERFAAQLPHFRMNDDREVHCYALALDVHKGRADADAPAQVLRHWYALRHADDGCSYAAAQLLAMGKIKAVDIWRKARLATEAKRPEVARKAVAIVAPAALPQLRQALDKPAKYLTGRAKAKDKASNKAPPELVVLALVRLAMSDVQGAARQLKNQWEAQLSPEERHWLWGLLGKQAALSHSPDALGYFARVGRDADLNDDMLAWKTRAALRAGQWQWVGKSIAAMSAAARSDSTWIYWQAHALLAQKEANNADRATARRLLESIAGTTGFYEQLALDVLGRRVTSAPAAPQPLSQAEKAAARANVGLNRGLYAILLGLRSEGVREWNYTTNMHTSGGMGERQLLAAADFACQMQVWDRCINTSERTKNVINMAQRFPMPYQQEVVARANKLGLDPAYVYGLIRQESRFIMDVRSSAGAQGLMQVMPATARWTAKKIGITDFKPEHIYDHTTNITIGTAYLKLALDSFDGSLPLAAAAYNAGPSRSRRWRKGRVLDGAIWIENVPFNETRDYVKKVLANTVNYAAILTGQPQSLRQRLGTIGPPATGKPQPNADLP